MSNQTSCSTPGEQMTPDMIDGKIKGASYHIFNKTLTVCCLTLDSGEMVLGESVCNRVEDFDKNWEEEISFIRARDKIWTIDKAKEVAKYE